MVVIILYGHNSKNWFLLIQSLFATVIMIQNMSLSNVIKSYLFVKDGIEEDNQMKNRLNSYLSGIEKSLNNNLLIVLNIGIVLQAGLLLIQSNQRINISSFVAMTVHYSI